MAPRVVVYGTGAVGSVLVYVLTRAGCDVTAICRSNYSAIRENGITIDAEIWGQGLTCRPHVVARNVGEAAASISSSSSTTDHKPFEYVVVASKALPSAQNSLAIQPLVTPGTTAIVLVQNGIGIEEEYARRFPRNPILSCAVYLPVTQTRPGHLTGVWMERLEIGTFPASAYEADAHVRAATDQYVRLHTAGGGTAVWHQEVQARRWGKLLLNATWNPMCALTLCRETALLGMGEDTVRVLHGVQDEVIAVAKALGYHEVDEASGRAIIKMSADRLGMPGSEPSMLTDILRGNRTELEVILGNPVRQARELGIAVPRLEMLYVLMTALDQATAKRTPGQSLGGDQVSVSPRQE